MNFYRIIAPDFFLGKLLSMIRALWDVANLIARHPSKRSLRITTLVLRVKPRFTMVTTRNLVALYNLVQDVERRKLPGCIVECGVWNGGSAAIMTAASVDAAYPIGKRTMWLFDLFEGLHHQPAKMAKPSTKRTLEVGARGRWKI